MIEVIKEKIAHFIVDQKIKEHEFTYLDFTDFFKKSFTFLVLMPVDDTDFSYSIEVLKMLEYNKKHSTVFTFDFKMNLVPARYRPHVIEFGHKDIGKLNLPSKSLQSKLSGKNFNVLLDLNIKENLFCSYVTSLIHAPIKIGFVRSESDKYYNLQIITRSENPENSYKNLLNCLIMF